MNDLTPFQSIVSAIGGLFAVVVFFVVLTYVIYVFMLSRKARHKRKIVSIWVYITVTAFMLINAITPLLVLTLLEDVLNYEYSVSFTEYIDWFRYGVAAAPLGLVFILVILDAIFMLFDKRALGDHVKALSKKAEIKN